MGRIIPYIVENKHVWNHQLDMMFQYILDGGKTTPLKNMSASIGIIIPNIWKNDPNHQPAL